MIIGTRARVRCRAGVERCFDLATDLDGFPRYFRGAGPVPAVERIEQLSATPTLPGARRHVHNSDGSVIVEELVELRRPERHAYRLVGGFRPPFSWLVREAAGEWRFHAEGGGTGIEWDYRFTLRSPLAWPLAAPIVQVFFRRAMQSCLDAMAAALTR